MVRSEEAAEPGSREAEPRPRAREAGPVTVERAARSSLMARGEALLSGTRAAEARRFLRFLGVGVINTLFGYGAFALVYLATGSHRAAIIVATVAGVLFNFLSTGRLVFGSSGGRAFVPFVAGYAVVLALNLALAEILVGLGVPALAAQAIALPVLVVTSYLINALLVFRPVR